MKTNHRRGFVAKTHNPTGLFRDKIMDKELGVVADNSTTTHHGPGREGFIKSQRAAKRFGHAKVRNAVRDTLIDQVKDLNTHESLGM